MMPRLSSKPKPTDTIHRIFIDKIVLNDDSDVTGRKYYCNRSQQKNRRRLRRKHESRRGSRRQNDNINKVWNVNKHTRNDWLMDGTRGFPESYRLCRLIRFRLIRIRSQSYTLTDTPQNNDNVNDDVRKNEETRFWTNCRIPVCIFNGVLSLTVADAQCCRRTQHTYRLILAFGMKWTVLLVRRKRRSSPPKITFVYLPDDS